MAGTARTSPNICTSCFPDLDVVAFHYRGYAPSTGSASAEAADRRCPAGLRLRRRALRPDRIIAVGFSIGSGIAAELAAEAQLDGLILVTPFDSLKAVAQAMYPWLPIGPFFEHEIDTASAIAAVQTPAAIIAAERDEIVPSERTAELRGRVPELRFDQTIARAGTTTSMPARIFTLAMREALAAVSH